MNASDIKSQISNLPAGQTGLTYNNYAIIVAGGSGTRMQADKPKQFLLLNQKPVLMHTMEAFHHSNTQPQLILTLPAGYHPYWKQLCSEHNFAIPHNVVDGGETRYHSVKNALDIIGNDKDALVAIHDAVRPLVSTRIIDDCYTHAAEHGNAITAVKSRDSVRQLKNDVSIGLVRDEIYLVQTPQTFKLSQIKNAYTQPYMEKFTDDASVAEQAGIQISLVAGSYRNIKITFPEDIAIAEMLMKKVNGS
jgi:2-C-methyl-D-erythritol 4-phosphate cytidylyltransferase